MKTFIVFDRTTSTATVVTDELRTLPPSEIRKFRKRLGACEAELVTIDAGDAGGGALGDAVRRLEKRYARGRK